MTFRDWLDIIFYPGFDASGLTDEEYYDLEDVYMTYAENEEEEDED